MMSVFSAYVFKLRPYFVIIINVCVEHIKRCCCCCCCCRLCCYCFNEKWYFLCSILSVYVSVSRLEKNTRRKLFARMYKRRRCCTGKKWRCGDVTSSYFDDDSVVLLDFASIWIFFSSSLSTFVFLGSCCCWYCYQRRQCHCVLCLYFSAARQHFHVSM